MNDSFALKVGIRLDAAPTARNMKARGKREARRPWLPGAIKERALKVRNIVAIIALFQSCTLIYA
jgi:hypothetical protein